MVRVTAAAIHASRSVFPREKVFCYVKGSLDTQALTGCFRFGLFTKSVPWREVGQCKALEMYRVGSKSAFS